MTNIFLVRAHKLNEARICARIIGVYRSQSLAELHKQNAEAQANHYDELACSGQGIYRSELNLYDAMYYPSRELPTKYYVDAQPIVDANRYFMQSLSTEEESLAHKSGIEQ